MYLAGPWGPLQVLHEIAWIDWLVAVHPNSGVPLCFCVLGSHSSKGKGYSTKGRPLWGQKVTHAPAQLPGLPWFPADPSAVRPFVPTAPLFSLQIFSFPPCHSLPFKKHPRRSLIWPTSPSPSHSLSIRVCTVASFDLSCCCRVPRSNTHHSFCVFDRLPLLPFNNALPGNDDFNDDKP